MVVGGGGEDLNKQQSQYVESTCFQYGWVSGVGGGGSKNWGGSLIKWGEGYSQSKNKNKNGVVSWWWGDSTRNGEFTKGVFSLKEVGVGWGWVGVGWGLHIYARLVLL